MAYVYLTIAIVAEVMGTLALKASDGFSKLQPSLIVLAGFAAALFFLSLAFRTVPVGVAYAIWSGLGTTLIVVASSVLFKQIPDAAALIRGRSDRRGHRGDKSLVRNGGPLVRSPQRCSFARTGKP